MCTGNDLPVVFLEIFEELHENFLFWMNYHGIQCPLGHVTNPEIGSVQGAIWHVTEHMVEIVQYYQVLSSWNGALAIHGGTASMLKPSPSIPTCSNMTCSAPKVPMTHFPIVQFISCGTFGMYFTVPWRFMSYLQQLVCASWPSPKAERTILNIFATFGICCMGSGGVVNWWAA